MVEAVARAIHDTDGMCRTTWPDGQGDDGFREVGYVYLCDCPEIYRQAARVAIAMYESMKDG